MLVILAVRADRERRAETEEVASIKCESDTEYQAKVFKKKATKLVAHARGSFGQAK